MIMIIPIQVEIIIGRNTNHQLHEIYPNNLKTTNINVNTLQNPKPQPAELLDEPSVIKKY